MALTDVYFQEGEGQDFLVELPVAVYSGTLSDAVADSGSQYPTQEIPSSSSRIFVISE